MMGITPLLCFEWRPVDFIELFHKLAIRFLINRWNRLCQIPVHTWGRMKRLRRIVVPRHVVNNELPATWQNLLSDAMGWAQCFFTSW